jgi:hypothetical protein
MKISTFTASAVALLLAALAFASCGSGSPSASSLAIGLPSGPATGAARSAGYLKPPILELGAGAHGLVPPPKQNGGGSVVIGGGGEPTASPHTGPTATPNVYCEYTAGHFRWGPCPTYWPWWWPFDSYSGPCFHCEPFGVAHDGNYIYVGTSSSTPIAVLNYQGKLVKVLNNTSPTLGLATLAGASGSGYLYAANSGTNTISVFLKGNIVSTVVDNNLSSIDYVAVDKKGDLFDDGLSESSGSAQVDKFAPNSPNATVFYQMPYGAYPGGLATGKKGVVYVVNEAGHSDILELTRNGGMIGQITPDGMITAIETDKSQKNLWAVDNTSAAAGGAAAEEYSVQEGGTFGDLIKWTPALPPGLTSHGLTVLPGKGV